MKTAALSLIAILSGCAAAPAINDPASYSVNILATDCRDIGEFGPVPAEDGLTWKLNPYLPTQRRVCWETVADQPKLGARCAQPANWNGTACVMSRNRDGTCWVSSTLTIAEAKQTGVYTPAALITGLSPVNVYQHEVDGHCQGYDHVEASVRPLLPR